MRLLRLAGGLPAVLLIRRRSDPLPPAAVALVCRRGRGEPHAALAFRAERRIRRTRARRYYARVFELRRRELLSLLRRLELEASASVFGAGSRLFLAGESEGGARLPPHVGPHTAATLARAQLPKSPIHPLARI